MQEPTTTITESCDDFTEIDNLIDNINTSDIETEYSDTPAETIIDEDIVQECSTSEYLPTGRNKLDKIFDNNFHDSENEVSHSFNFKIDPSFDTPDDPESEIHLDMLFREIHELIQNSKFKSLNDLNAKGTVTKLNKVQINEVYTYITKNVSVGYKKLEIWATLSDYFDIYPNKFYNSLSNIYKHQLVLELDAKLAIVEKKNIKRLF